MNIVVDLNTALMILVGGLVSWAVAGIMGINRKLSELNGSVKKLCVWKEEHTKLSDEREAATIKNLETVWRKIEGDK